jgi:hypothetical protein
MSEQEQLEHQVEALKKLILLPKAAESRFRRAADTKVRLVQAGRSQKDVIDDLSLSLPDTKDIQSEIAAIDEKIAGVNAQLQQAQDALLNTLAANEQSDSVGGDIIKTLLSNCELALLSIAKAAADKGQIAVSLLPLIELEDDLAKTIEKLNEKGDYPESQEEARERMAAQHAHAGKVIQFLTALKNRTEGQLAGTEQPTE